MAWLQTVVLLECLCGTFSLSGLPHDVVWVLSAHLKCALHFPFRCSGQGLCPPALWPCLGNLNLRLWSSFACYCCGAHPDEERPQVMRCADKGADMVRITIQGRQEALAGQKIRDKLFQKGCRASASAMPPLGRSSHKTVDTSHHIRKRYFK